MNEWNFANSFSSCSLQESHKSELPLGSDIMTYFITKKGRIKGGNEKMQKSAVDR